MANELSLTVKLEYIKGNVNLKRLLTKTPTVTGTATAHDIQNIGTAEETLGVGEVTLAGYALFYNLDATNYIEIGKAAATYSIKLKPGEFAVLRLDSWSAIYAKANTAPVDLEYILFSD